MPGTLFSILIAGIAPRSFYHDDSREGAHYDGVAQCRQRVGFPLLDLPVELFESPAVQLQHVVAAIDVDQFVRSGLGQMSPVW